MKEQGERMNRRNFLAASGAVLAASRVMGGVQRKRPNVLFVLADDLGIEGLNCFGADFLETPHLDRLCAQGMKGTGGIAPYPTCKPSRAVILTGQYAPRTGVYRVVDRHKGQEDKIRFLVPPNGDVSAAITTMAVPFKQAGYATAMYGKWHISPDSKPETHPKSYGFDEAIESHKKHFNAKTNPKLDLPEGMSVEELLTGKALDFMTKAAKREQPFFLFMPYYWVHGPLEADPKLVDYFTEKLKDRSFKGKKAKDVPVIAAMTKMLDDQVGRLLAKIEELGLEKDTLVVFTSDNGSFNENFCGDYRGRKGQVYEGGMRVPYIFNWPGRIPAGGQTDERIVGADLFPTFLSLANVPAPKDHVLDGIDLSPVLLGQAEKLPERDIFCYFPKYAGYKASRNRWADSWRNVVYSGDYKLTEYPEYDEVELFNLKEDPYEKKDLSKKSPEKRQELTKRLHKWLKKTNAAVPQPNPDYDLDK